MTSSRLHLARRMARAALAGLLLLALPAAPAAADPAGVFATAAEIARAESRLDTEGGRAFLARALRGLDRVPDPFAAAGPEVLRFGWLTHEIEPPDDTLREAVLKLRRDSSAMRDQALAFALTGEARHAETALALMRAWAEAHTPVNFYDYDPDFAAGTHRGQTRGFRSDRPWNFGLDSIWQAYGLANAADALVLLESAGAAIGEDDGALIRGWLRDLAAATNAGFHAWTRWADAHARPGWKSRLGLAPPPEENASVIRYRSDNHLSWALVGLLAAAAALDDPALAAYALEGGVWDDGRSGPYANPSTLPEMIERAILPGGQIYDEAIGRAPPIGYGLFHLEALALAARIAAHRFDRDVWRHRGADGAGLIDAFRRYAPYLTGQMRSPSAAESHPVRARWLFALSPAGFGGADREALLAAAPLGAHWTHVLGPARLLFAP